MKASETEKLLIRAANLLKKLEKQHAIPPGLQTGLFFSDYDDWHTRREVEIRQLELRNGLGSPRVYVTVVNGTGKPIDVRTNENETFDALEIHLKDKNDG